MNTTRDALFDGEVVLEQPARGYRFNVDSALLCAWVHGQAPEAVVDIGSGVGPVGLSLGVLDPSRFIVCVERDDELHALCARNAELNRLPAERVRVVHGDVRAWAELAELPMTRSHADKPRTEKTWHTVMNPPYFAPSSGRLSELSQKAVARHQLFGTLQELLASAVRVATTGTHSVVYPTRYLNALVDAAQRNGLVMDRLRFVHPREGAPATTALATFVRASTGRECVVERPLALRRSERDDYTDEAAHVLRTGFMEPATGS